MPERRTSPPPKTFVSMLECPPHKGNKTVELKERFIPGEAEGSRPETSRDHFKIQEQAAPQHAIAIHEAAAMTLEV